MAIYPIVMTLVIYVVIFGKKVTAKAPYVGAMLASTVIGFLGLLKILGLLDEATINQLNIIPFFENDLGWIIPSIIGFVIGLFVKKS